MVPLDRGTFRAWLDAYEAAWEAGDADAATALFATGATYYPTPFADPLRGRDAIRAHWSETTADQASVRVETTVEAVDRDRGFAHVAASFVRDGDRVAVDGLLVARFAAGDCVELHEWRHSRD
jgi:ketosteroid isomerase-like protein